MAEFSKLTITNNGRALAAKMMSGVGNINFTKISSSDNKYTLEDLENLTSLSKVKQTSLISKVTRTDKTSVKVETAFNNSRLTTGYYMRALGLYAVDPDEGEILFGITIETTGNCYMPPYNGATASGAYIQLITTVGNAEKVSLQTDAAAVATIGDINELREQFDNKVDKIEGKGLSTNDYTTAEKNKLLGIEAGAQKNSITGVKGNAETSYRTGNVNITPANIGAAAASHTHNYAGSSSAGGTANSANKLNTNAGSSLRPVYFNNGIPAACSYNVPIAEKNTIDLTSGDYDQNTYYPVKSSAGLSDNRYSHISVYTALNTCKPSWSQHAQGYSAFFGLIINGEKWGANWGDCLVYADTYRYCAVSPMSFFQTSATSSPVLYLRGGGKYNVTTDFSCAWTIYKDGFTDHNETVSPKTDRPAIPYSRNLTQFAGSSSAGGAANSALTVSSLQTSLFNANSLNSSTATVEIENLFTDYKAVICNINGDSKSSSVLPLNHIKNCTSIPYYGNGCNHYFRYVDNNTMTIYTGFAQSNPKINSVEIISLY